VRILSVVFICNTLYKCAFCPLCSSATPCTSAHFVRRVFLPHSVQVRISSVVFICNTLYKCAFCPSCSSATPCTSAHFVRRVYLQHPVQCASFATTQPHDVPPFALGPRFIRIFRCLSGGEGGGSRSTTAVYFSFRSHNAL
jgi:hypothetical protein